LNLASNPVVQALVFHGDKGLLKKEEGCLHIGSDRVVEVLPGKFGKLPESARPGTMNQSVDSGVVAKAGLHGKSGLIREITGEDPALNAFHFTMGLQGLQVFDGSGDEKEAQLFWSVGSLNPLLYKRSSDAFSSAGDQYRRRRHF
jgi:hypothetical protein